MPEQVRCPECDATLRVPDSLLGKSVKCPKCQATFTAELPGEPEEGIVPEPSRAVSRRPRIAPEETEEDEPPPEEEEEDDEDRPRRRRRGRRVSRGMAESQVSGPAISLMVVGIIDIVLGIFNLLMRILNVGLVAANAPQAKQGVGDPGLWAAIFTGVIGAIVTIVFGIVITLGASKMKNLSSYGLAMTTCILAMIPCFNCCCLGLPFGIWGLVVLNQPEVKDAFS